MHINASIKINTTQNSSEKKQHLLGPSTYKGTTNLETPNISRTYRKSIMTTNHSVSRSTYLHRIKRSRGADWYLDTHRKQVCKLAFIVLVQALSIASLLWQLYPICKFLFLHNNASKFWHKKSISSQLNQYTNTASKPTKQNAWNGRKNLNEGTIILETA